MKKDFSKTWKNRLKTSWDNLRCENKKRGPVLPHGKTYKVNIIKLVSIGIDKWMEKDVWPMHMWELGIWKGDWWSILCANLSGIRDARIAGKTSLLGVSVRLFLAEISVRTGRLSEEVMGITQNSEGPAEHRGRGRVNWLSEEQDTPFLLPWHIGALGSLPFWLALGLTRLGPQVVRPLVQKEPHYFAFLGLQPAEDRQGTSRPP